MLGEESEELTQRGALYQCAKERLSSSLLREYMRWVVEQNASEQFSSLIKCLCQWSKIIENAPQASKRIRPPMISHNQTLCRESPNNYSSTKESFVPVCAWHQKEKGVVEKHYLDRCAEFKALTVKERRDFVYANRLCKICFKRNHFAKDCKNKRALCKRCRSDKNKHHFLLHENCVGLEASQTHTSEVVESNNCQIQQSAISLQTVPVFVQSGENRIKINALLDSGSNTSFISQSLIKTLGIEPYDHETRVMHTLNSCDQALEVSRVKVELCSVNGDFKRTECLTAVPDILQNSKPVVWQQLKNEWSHLKRITFPRLANRPHHELLIGTDLIYYHRCLKEVLGSKNAPIARLTPLGWSCVGPTGTRQGEYQTYQCNVNCCQVVDTINEEVSKMWSLDALGIDTVHESSILTPSEQYAQNLLKEKLKCNEGFYEAPILWKDEKPSVNNYEAVSKRVKCMERKLAQRPGVVARCDEVISSYLEKDYIAKVPESQKYAPGFYVPHFPIIKEDRTTSKVRLVFDAAAKYNGKSLNDRIYPGPKLQNDIVDIMIKFRRSKFGVIADISEMYLQIGLLEEDRKFCRFVWKDQIYEFKRLMFGRSDAPFIALYVLKENALAFAGKYPEAVRSITQCMYIDDLATSCESEKEVCDLYHQTLEIFKHAGMKVHKWNSNSRMLLESIPASARVPGGEQILTDDLPTTKLLGLSWDAGKDVLSFVIKIPPISVGDSSSPTKRQILRTLARVYDPMGYLCPFLIVGK